MDNSNVQKSFDNGKAARAKMQTKQGPLRASSYKIRELRSICKKYRDALERYGSGVRTKKVPNCVGPCMGDEAEDYFKNLPATIARHLGHDLVGVLDSLAGDGLSPSQIAEIEKRIDDQLPVILSLGEEAEVEMETQWEATKLDIGGRSTLDELFESCSQLLDEVIAGVARYEN